MRIAGIRVATALLVLSAIIAPCRGTRAAVLPTAGLLRILDLGGNSAPMALDAADNRVFVLDSVRDRVYVLDSRNGQLVDQTRLPGAGRLRTAAYDPVTRHLIVAAAHQGFRKRNQTPLELDRVYTLDGPSLRLVREAVADRNKPFDLGQQPEDAVADKRTGRVFVLLTFGTLAVVNSKTGSLQARIAAGGEADQEQLDSSTGLLFVNNRGQDLRGASKSLTVINTRSLRVVRRLAVAPIPPPASPPVPSGQESSRLLGLDPWNARLFLIGFHWWQPATAVVSIDALNGRKAGSVLLPALGPGFVDRQLKRVYVATASSPSGIDTPDQITVLTEDLTVLHTIPVGGTIGAIGVDIHAHRIFTVDSLRATVHIFDSWSGTLLRTFHLSRPANDQYGGFNPVSILISGQTHRAFIGEGNGKIAVFNSALQQ